MVEVAGHYLFIPVVRVLSFINREGVKEGSETGKGGGREREGGVAPNEFPSLHYLCISTAFARSPSSGTTNGPTDRKNNSPTDRRAR